MQHLTFDLQNFNVPQLTTACQSDMIYEFEYAKEVVRDGVAAEASYRGSAHDGTGH